MLERQTIKHYCYRIKKLETSFSTLLNETYVSQFVYYIRNRYTEEEYQVAFNLDLDSQSLSFQANCDLAVAYQFDNWLTDIPDNVRGHHLNVGGKASHLYHYLSNHYSHLFCHRASHRLGFLLLLVSNTHPALNDFVNDTTTFALLAEHINEGNNISELVKLKRPELLKVLILKIKNSTLPEHAYIPNDLCDESKIVITPGVYKLIQTFYSLSRGYLEDEPEYHLTLQILLTNTFITQKLVKFYSKKVAVFFPTIVNLVKFSMNYLDFLQNMSFKEIDTLYYGANDRIRHYMRDRDFADLFKDISSMEKEIATYIGSIIKVHIKKANQIFSYHDDLCMQLYDIHAQYEKGISHVNLTMNVDDIFPLNPLPKINTLHYLSSARLLRLEGKTMHHCLGSASYVSKCKSGNYAAFRLQQPERATLFVKVNSNKTVLLLELKKYRNDNVNNDTLSYVRHIIETHNELITV